MSKHTPGPWRIDDEYAGLLEQDQHRFWINADIHIAYVDGPRNAERTANAHLIAAAPELLEALRSLHVAMACYDGTPEETLALDAARAVIAKATGEAA